MASIQRRLWRMLAVTAIATALSGLVGASTVSAATPGATVTVPPTVTSAIQAALSQRQAATTATRHICYQAYVQDIGWQSFVACDGFIAGTTHQSRRMEALAIGTQNVGGVCANAWLQDIGWQGVQCAADGRTAIVGTEHQSRRMEALNLQVGSGTVCANASLANVGWQGVRCGNPVFVGTQGQSRQMEAITITV
jgi:uncharacterized protein YjdB